MSNKVLSDAAVTVATLLVSRCHGDPKVDFATVVAESQLAPTDVGAAVAELEAAKLVGVSHALGEGAYAFRSVRPMSALFWALDPQGEGLGRTT